MPRYRHLDGLRGAAALIVVFHHCAMTNLFPFFNNGHINFLPRWLSHALCVFINGPLSVHIFWTMSGFVLSAGLLAAKHPVRAAAGAFVRRYPRLVIPCLCSCVLAWLLLRTGLIPRNFFLLPVTNWMRVYYQFAPNLEQAIASGSILFRGTDNYNAVLWTMQGELLGSFAVFFMCLLPIRPRLALTGALTAAGYIFYYFNPTVLGFHFQMNWVLCFMAGLLLGVVERNWPEKFHFPDTPPATGLAMGCAVVFFGVLTFFWSNERTDAVLACGAVWSIHHFEIFKRFFATKPLVWLGKISFPLYLTHIPIMFSFGFYTASKLAGSGREIQAWACTIVTLGVSLIIAVLFEKYIDRSAINMSKTLSGKLAALWSLCDRVFSWRAARHSAFSSAGLSECGVAQGHVGAVTTSVSFPRIRMNAPVFSKSILIHRPASEVRAWLARPGVAERLTPPWWREENGGAARVFEPPTGHECRLKEEGAAECSLTDEIAGAAADDARLERLFAWRHTTISDDIELLAAHGAVRKMKFAVAGASGLLGRALTVFLRTQGHEVLRLTRRAAAADGELFWNPAEGAPDAEALRGVDVLVNLAGEGVAEGRWTAARREAIRGSRVNATRALVAAVEKMTHRPHLLVSASAAAFYGSRGDDVLDETGARGGGFLAEVCEAWEREALAARELGLRVALMRFGTVLSPEGGALARMLPLFRAGHGGHPGDGRQWISWALPDDAAGAIYHAVLSHACDGPVNAASPNPVTGAEFAATLARVLGKPTGTRAPAWVLRLKFGAAFADELLLASRRVSPERLLNTGFVFRHARLETALRHVLGK